MYSQQGSQHLFPFHHRNHCLDAHFRLKMQRVYFSHMRTCPLTCAEGTLPHQVVAAAVVVAYVPRASIEKGIAHTLGILHRDRGHKLQQCAASGLQDLHLLQLEHLCQLVVNTSQCIIEIGMGRINYDVVPDGHHDTTFHISFPCERLKRTEGNGMMGDDEVTTQSNGFLHHIFGYVYGQQDTSGLFSLITHLQSAIVKIVL